MRGRSQQLTLAVAVAVAVTTSALLGCGTPRGGEPLGPPPDMDVVLPPPTDGGPTDGGGSGGRRDMGEAVQDAGTSSTDLGAVTDSAVTVDAGPQPGGCPSVDGAYPTIGSGPGCGGATSGTQTITQATLGACQLTFTSSGLLNGDATIASDGSFAGQTLSVAGTTRSCRGTWTSTTTSYAISCGSGPSLCNFTLQ